MLEELRKMEGEMAESLLRNAGKIKEDRALTVLRMAEKFYRRRVEDIKERIENLTIEQSNRLDMSPDDINTLKVAADFDAEAFYNKDKQLTLSIREAKVELEEMEARYNRLFRKKLQPVTQS